MSQKGKIVSLLGIAAMFGIHRNTAASWVKKGCPYIQKADRNRGIEWQLDTAAVAQWRLDLAIQDAIGDTETATEAELQRRKLAADTTIAELNAAKARGELGSIEEFRQQVTGTIVEIRQRLMQIPGRVEPGDSEKRDIIADEITQALTAISDEFGND